MSSRSRKFRDKTMNSPISRKPVTRITAIAEKTHDGRAHNSSNGGPYRGGGLIFTALLHLSLPSRLGVPTKSWNHLARVGTRSEEHTSELQSPDQLVCRLLLEKKKGRIRAASTAH